MSVLSTLRNSVTKIVGTRVTWHPQGITAVRVFTIEPCAAIPKRTLERKRRSRIKNANPEEANPFTVISELKPDPRIIVQEKLPSELKPDPRIIVQEKLPKKPHRCHSHTMALVQGWLQQLGDGVDINHSYMYSELPLSFIEDHSMAYGKVQGWLQQLDGGGDINHLYMKSELPLFFYEEDTEQLYD